MFHAHCALAELKHHVDFYPSLGPVYATSDMDPVPVPPESSFVIFFIKGDYLGLSSEEQMQLATFNQGASVILNTSWQEIAKKESEILEKIEQKQLL